MSSSAAFASSPAPDADSFGLRPLDAIAATSNGGVPQSRVHRILTDLAAPLAALHEQGQIHGALSPATIGLDMTGKAHLMPRPSGPGAAMMAGKYPGLAEGDSQGNVASNAQGPAAGEDEFDLPQAGYAAFEQYADDELLPRGPWTDVYGLSAVACQLITGAPPPDAEARRDGDEYLPLAQRMPAGYDAAFLAAVDAGLAMAAARRPNSMAAYLALFGGMEPAPAMPALSEPEVVVVQEEYDEEDDDDELEPKARRRLSFWAVFIVLLAAVVAVPIWLWLSSGNGLSGNRTPRAGAAGGSSFVPLTQRDPRAADAGRSAGADGATVAGGAGAAAGGGSAATGGTDGGTAGGYANGGQGGVQGGNPGASVSNGGSSGAADGSSSGSTSGNLAAAPASTLNGSGNPTNTGAGPGASAAEGGAGSGGENVAAGGSGNTGTPDAAASRAGAGGQSAQAAGDSANAGRAAGAPQPYHSTVTLGGWAPAAAGAQPPRATDGTGAGTPASGDASADAQAGAGQGTQARTGAAAAGTATATKPAATGAPVPVRIDVRPWGEIIIDGVARGVSPPLKELRLAPGKHSVIIKNTGLPNFRMTLEVKAGTPATLSHVFN